MLASRTTIRTAWTTAYKWWLSKQRDNSQGDNKLQMLLHSWAVSPTTCRGPLSRGATGICILLHTAGGAGWVSLGSLLLPSKVAPVTSWSLLPQPCISPAQAATEPPHLILSRTGLWPAHRLRTSDRGSLGNLCILVKNGFHCTLRVSSS